ncbi:pentatricopeptide repeat-containing protein At5g16860-like isoform X2 [Phragmites australis]|uniref:pentatricopeptide repeat-containing protein At5g16860-like isoform X2 n=1 Tax=Phragmites australis TaxID=29695 RepID=UPI002D784D38|nr:pentatricopeptide repeat-containing protein At5g16860-like isoform X2 [Phragmites australis]
MLFNLPKAAKPIGVRFLSVANAECFGLDVSPMHFASLLKECRSVNTVRQIHQKIIASGLLSRPASLLSVSLPPLPSQPHVSPKSLGTGVVASYLACGATSDALTVLEHVAPSTVVWWNLLIREHIKEGRLDRAIGISCRMIRAGTRPDHFTLPYTLKACGELPSYRCGSTFHGLICCNGFESNVFVCNALVAMYSRCGYLKEATLVFDEITQKGIDDVISWNSIVAAHVKGSNPWTALDLFSKMTTIVHEKATNERSDIISIVNILPACASLNALPQTKEIHGYAIRNGTFPDSFVCNALIDTYAKCGSMEDAVKVFNMMEFRDAVSWNAMVTGYSQSGNFEAAFELFNNMRKESIPLDVITWSAVISGYAQRGCGQEALDTFRQMLLYGSEPNSVTIISLLSACASLGALPQDMYSKCRSFKSAHSMFDSIPRRERNVVTWTVMIGGYAQFGNSNDALKLFSEMISIPYAVAPNAYTISCILMACAHLAALRMGKQIHAYVIRHHQYETSVYFVANCLIDMYSKCGDVDTARNVFDSMPKRNDVSWTSMMSGYGMHGRGNEALDIFDKMQKAGFVPDDISFLVLLYACSHSGMVDQGLDYFEIMSRDYGVAASAEHYACVIDLQARSGLFDKAWRTVEEMPMEPTAVIWVALLSACRVHSNVELAEYALNKLVKMKAENDGSYTLISNIYANARRWKDVARIRQLMKNSGIKKRPGCSWVQGKKGTASFFVGDRSHPRSPEIYALLERLIDRIKAVGYVPETNFALHDVDDEEKNNLLAEHSEKLALAYGLLTTSPGCPIRITKNLRICGDCHSAFTYISKIVDHEIILRDSSRFHHFKNGSCSCGGYW